VRIQYEFRAKLRAGLAKWRVYSAPTRKPEVRQQAQADSMLIAFIKSKLEQMGTDAVWSLPRAAFQAAVVGGASIGGDQRC